MTGAHLSETSRGDSHRPALGVLRKTKRSVPVSVPAKRDVGDGHNVPFSGSHSGLDQPPARS